MLLMTQRTGVFNLDKAVSMAAELQSGDEDFTYTVEDCKNGYGRIDVYDEEGILLHKGFVI